MHTTRPNLLVALHSLADPRSRVDDFDLAFSFVRSFLVGTDGSLDPDLSAAFLDAQAAIRLRRETLEKLSVLPESQCTADGYS